MFRITLILFFLSSSGHAKNLKIINWNLYLLPKIAKLTAQDQRTKLVAKYLLNSQEDFDIITLQEVFTKSGFKILTEALKEKYPYHTGMPHKKWYKPVNSGLLILSKYPIKQKDFYFFSRMAHADRFSSKGILSTIIEVDKENLIQVMTTHFQAQEGKKYKKIRKSEYEYLTNKVFKDFEDLKLPSIVTGDFNIDLYCPSEFEPFINYIGFEFPVISGDLQYTVDSKINNLVQPYKQRPIVQEVLDYIFFRPQNDFQNQIRTYILDPKGDYYYQGSKISAGSLSDHLPVISIISI